MTQNESTQEPMGPVEVVVRRMKELREKRRLSGARLAERMREQGIPWKRDIVANLENGRRASVGVDELLALAVVLEVAPVHLLVPLEDQDYEVTPGRVEPSEWVREWVRGHWELEGMDPRLYFSEVPREEYGLFADRRGESKAEKLESVEHVIIRAQREAERLRREIDQEGNADG